MAEDRQTVNGIRLLAANPNHPIEFYDESVSTPYNSTNADYIKRQIREKISRTSVTVCILNTITYTSQWVAWELEESLKKGNTIIPMGVPGLKTTILPAPIGNMRWWLWDMQHLKNLIEAAP